MTTQSWPSLSETDERGLLLRNLADRVHRIVLTSGEWDSRIPGLHLSYVQNARQSAQLLLRTLCRPDITRSQAPQYRGKLV